MVVYTEYDTDTRVRREAETLAEQAGYEVIVLTLKRGIKPKKFKLNGVKVVELNASKYYGDNKIRYILSYLRFTLISLIACSRLTLGNKVDVVHVHNMPNFLIFSAILAKLIGKKVILDLHDTVPETYVVKFNNGNRLLFSALCIEEAIACKIADKLICVNHIQKEALVQRGIPANKITISMNVPDPRLFNQKKKLDSIRVSNNFGFKIVYHGTIAERLGIDLIIRAIDKIKNQIHDLEFHFWGRGGGSLDRMLKLTKKLGIENMVQSHAAIPIEQLIPTLLTMDVGVIGNRKNAATELMLPVKMLEYVALGIPVVAPRLKAIQYYFKDDMVSYYEPEDVDSMAQAILRLYKNPSLRKKQARNAQAFLKKYGWEKHKLDLINLYRKF